MKDGAFTANRLLALYDRVAEAEDAIPRLRRFVLDLAVRGKLVEQDPSDEPAAELLKRIAKEKARLVKAGEIAAFKGIDPPTDGDLAFAIPPHWQPVLVATILNELQTGPFGSSLHQSDYRLVGTPVINPTSIQNEKIVPIDKMAVDDKTLERLASFKLRSGDIVMARRGEMGRCAVVTENESGWLCGTGSLILRPSALIYARFLVLVIGSPFGREYLGSSSVGATMQNLNQSILLNLPFGLPPLAEQRRIVAKVEELMTLCDRLQAARAGREAVRDRLTAATWARLTAPETDARAFPTHARTALQTLPTLTTRPDQIKTLRQTILNLAVRGKLVEQDPTDEPAAELLKRIGGEIAAYSKSERITHTLPASVEPSEQEFDLPKGWSWTRLCGLFNVITDGDHQPPPKADDGIAFLTIGNVTTGKLDFAGCRTVPAAYFDALPRYRTPRKGDILYTVVGATYGRPALVETDRPFCVQRHIAIMKPSASMNLRFLLHLLASPMVYDQATRGTTGTAQPTIALRPLRNFVIAVPPLAEQHRIVARVDALMALCDQLEASLTTAATTRSRLIEALLRQALGGQAGAAA